MDGYLLLADGTRLDGQWVGAPQTVVGWVAANTAVVGFQEMVTDAAYKGRLLAFTYPEIGNVGVTAAFAESGRLQVAGLVVKVLSAFTSHYRCEGSLDRLLADGGAGCLTDVDTRGLAVHLREHGEMPGAIAPADTDAEALGAQLDALDRPTFAPPASPPAPDAHDGPVVAVIDLGIRRSQLAQLGRCARPVVFGHDADVRGILDAKPAGVFVSDGPGDVLPPDDTVTTLGDLVGRVPVLACGLGHVALGVALGGKATFLKRGHHGANCPVRHLPDGSAEVTQQRHTVALDRDSVGASAKVDLVCEHINDQSVEGIRTPDGTASGWQAILAAPHPAAVNAHIAEFIEGLDKD